MLFIISQGDVAYLLADIVNVSEKVRSARSTLALSV